MPKTIIQPLVGNFFILMGGMAVAIQARLELQLGATLGSDYQPLNLAVLLLILGCNIAAVGVAYAAEQFFAPRWLTPQRQFRVLMLAMLLSIATTALFFPDISLLQLVYFGLLTTVLGLLVIVFAGRLRKTAYIPVTVGKDLSDLYDKRNLIAVWLGFRIKARYANTALGILWIILLPLSSSAVMAFAFTQFLGARGGSVPFIAFLLSGHVVFMIFNKVIMEGRNALLQMMGIIKQVYFPREIIILLIVGEAVIDFIFTFVAMLIVNAVVGIFPNIYYVFLPIPVLLMILLSLGLAFIVSWASLIIKDLQQLIGVIMQLLFYVTVLFSEERVDMNIGFVTLLNPLSAITESYRDIILYGQPPNVTQLSFATVITCALLYVGYVYFKVNEDRFVDFV